MGQIGLRYSGLLNATYVAIPADTKPRLQTVNHVPKTENATQPPCTYRMQIVLPPDQRDIHHLRQ